MSTFNPLRSNEKPQPHFWHYPDLGNAIWGLAQEYAPFPSKASQASNPKKDCLDALNAGGPDLRCIDEILFSRTPKGIESIPAFLVSLGVPEPANVLISKKLLQIVPPCFDVEMTNENNRKIEYRVTGILSNKWWNRHKGFLHVKREWANTIFVGKNGNHFVFLANSHGMSSFDENNYGQSLLETRITMGVKSPAVILGDIFNDQYRVVSAHREMVNIVIDWSLKYDNNNNNANVMNRYVHLKLGLKRPKLNDVCVLLVHCDYIEKEAKGFLDGLMNDDSLFVSKEKELENEKKNNDIDDNTNKKENQSKKKKKEKDNDNSDNDDNKIERKSNVTQCVVGFGKILQDSKARYDVVGQKVNGLAASGVTYGVTHGEARVIDVSDDAYFGRSAVLDMVGGRGASGAGGWHDGKLVFIAECNYNADMIRDKLRCVVITRDIEQLLLYPFDNGMPIECDPFVSHGAAKDKLLTNTDKAYEIVEREASFALADEYRAKKVLINPIPDTRADNDDDSDNHSDIDDYISDSPMGQDD